MRMNPTRRRTASARRAACLLLAAALLVPGFPGVQAAKLSEQYPVSSDDDLVVYESEPDYASVLAGWQKDGWEAAKAASPVRLPGTGIARHEGEAPQTITLEGKECLSWETDTQAVEWSFTVETAGLYVLQIEYYAAGGSGLPIQRAVQIDGESPYTQAGNIVLPRRFVDASDPRVNNLGDEVRPMQQEVRAWLTRDIADAQGKYTEPLLWKLEAGTHTLRMDYIDQPVAIAAIAFRAPEQVPAYADVQRDYAANGYTEAKEPLVIQAEDRADILYKTQGTIAGYNDGDPMTEPEGVTSVKLNAMGGYNWREGGQELAYQITIAPGQAGLYKLAMRVQQSWGNGLASCRQVLLDGRVPFREMLAYPFPYTRDWDTHTLSDEQGDPYLFYLSEGTHTLTFTVKLSEEITQALAIMQACTENLSLVIRQITLITGADPDPNYDYDLEKAIPDLLGTFQKIEEQLGQAKERILQTANKRPSTVNNLEMTIRQLQEMRAKPESIHKRLDDMTTSLTSLGDWMTDLQSSPLGIDTLGFYPPAAVIAQRHSNFFMKTWATLRNFAASFSKDYDAVGGFGDGAADKTLDVWISRGKEWSAILQELIDADFTPTHGIGVRLNVLPTGTLSAAVNPLLLAVNSGTAPDAVLSLANNLPVEYAIRDAVADLSQMEGFDQTAERFDPKIFTPLKYRGGVYALPETANFRVLFYRKDIFSDLKLKLPDTWTEIFYDLLPVLYQNGMQMFIPSAYDLFLFQYGGQMYTDDGLRTGLDTPEAFAAFEQLIALYTDLGIPISANFYNRFRSGEMPIGIDSYTMYMTLLTAAPELAGKWGIAPLPGTERDGEIDRSTAILTSETDVIMQQSDNKAEAWQFLQWWTSTETQTRFGAEVEGRIGTYARWNTANREAFQSLPWNRSDLAVILEQWQWSEDPPTVLGGYYTTRHITNALNRCLYSNQSPRDSLEEAVEAINKELERKQQLYGIFTDETARGEEGQG